MDILKRVNRTKVTPELLSEVVAMHTNLPPEDRGAFDARAIALFKLFDQKGIFGKKRADLAVAIDFKLTALARLLQEHQVRGWTLSADAEGTEFIHHDLLRAAAEEPVFEGADGQAVFDPESFGTRVLRLSEAIGEA